MRARCELFPLFNLYCSYMFGESLLRFTIGPMRYNHRTTDIYIIFPNSRLPYIDEKNLV